MWDVRKVPFNWWAKKKHNIFVQIDQSLDLVEAGFTKFKVSMWTDCMTFPSLFYAVVTIKPMHLGLEAKPVESCFEFSDVIVPLLFFILWLFQLWCQ